MYEFTSLFLYKLLFTIELFVAEFILCIGLQRKRNFLLRLTVCFVALMAFAFLLPVISHGYLWCSVMFLSIFAASVFVTGFLYDEPFGMIIFYSIAGYTTQHIAYELFDLVSVVFNFATVGNQGVYGDSLFNFSDFFYGSGTGANANPLSLMLYGYVYGMTYFFSYLFTRSKKDRITNARLEGFETVAIVAVILLFDVFFSSVVTNYSKKVYERTYIVIACSYNVFCCLLATYLQFGVALRNRLRDDIVSIKNLWAKDKEQYELTKANIEMINLKCHDLRHQIRRIGLQGAVDGNQIKEIESIVSIYDSRVKTGNDALDVILTEKSLVCNAKKIKLCCIADGSGLSFMSESELYSMFGNLLDNAIEAVSVLEEEKRVISLSVKRKYGFLSINAHNYYSSNLVFDGSLPKTTKQDKFNHGYGMKSLKLLCEKYGGELSVTAEKNVFNVNIIFPLND